MEHDISKTKGYVQTSLDAFCAQAITRSQNTFVLHPNSLQTLKLRFRVGETAKNLSRIHRKPVAATGSLNKPTPRFLFTRLNSIRRAKNDDPHYIYASADASGPTHLSMQEENQNKTREREFSRGGRFHRCRLRVTRNCIGVVVLGGASVPAN